MKRYMKFSCLALLAVSLLTVSMVGCGSGSGSKVIEPEMTAEEIQAKADAKSDEDVDPT